MARIDRDNEEWTVTPQPVVVPAPSKEAPVEDPREVPAEPEKVPAERFA